jgi:hypothetical protein
MLAVLVGVAVLFAQQIDEELTLLGMVFLEPDRKRHLARLSIEIVHKQHPIVAPVPVKRAQPSLKLGTIEITVVSDGMLEFPAETLFGDRAEDPKRPADIRVPTV